MNDEKVEITKSDLNLILDVFNRIQPILETAGYPSNAALVKILIEKLTPKE